MNGLNADAAKGVSKAEVNAIKGVTELKTPNIKKHKVDTHAMSSADHFQLHMVSVPARRPHVIPSSHQDAH